MVPSSYSSNAVNQLCTITQLPKLVLAAIASDSLPMLPIAVFGSAMVADDLRVMLESSA